MSSSSRGPSSIRSASVGAPGCWSRPTSLPEVCTGLHPPRATGIADTRLEEMADEEAEATLRRIQAPRSDPFVRFLDEAPADDEPVTAEEAAALAEVEAERAAAVPTIPFDDVKRKYA